MADDRRVSPLRAVAAVGAMTTVMLAVAAVGQWLVVPSATVRSWDEGGVSRAADLLTGHPGLHDVAVAWAAVSGPWVVHPLVLGLTLALMARRRVTARALLVVAIGVVGWFLGAAAKQIVDRPRPADALVEVGSWSYPSGHATNVALGAVLVVALTSTARSAWIRWGTSMLALVCVALTATDRLALGVHYPSDVLAGLALGTGVAVVGLATLRPLTGTRARRAGDRPG